MRRKITTKKKGTKAEDKSHKLVQKIASLANDIREEYDMMELVEGEIEDIFSCDLECHTCSEKERAFCLTSFKKANLYWLRKIVQDEKILMDYIEKIDETRLLSIEMYKILREQLKELKSSSLVTKKMDEIVDKMNEENKTLDKKKSDMFI